MAEENFGTLAESVGGPKTVEVTWQRALKVWWSITWRQTLIALGAGLVIGAIVGAILGALKVNVSAIITVTQIVGAIIGAGVGIWVIKMVLGKEYSDFKLELTKK